MFIRVTGKIDKKIKDTLSGAATFYLEKMMDSLTSKNVVVDIKVRKSIEDNHEGMCDITGYDGRNRPREFDIYVKKSASVRFMLMTLAHECVHLKQYAMGELQESHLVWRGVKMDPDINYWESPWEIEAFGRERGLYSMYCEKLGHKFDRAPGVQERDE